MKLKKRLKRAAERMVVGAGIGGCFGALASVLGPPVGAGFSGLFGEAKMMETVFEIDCPGCSAYQLQIRIWNGYGVYSCSCGTRFDINANLVGDGSCGRVRVHFTRPPAPPPPPPREEFSWKDLLQPALTLMVARLADKIAPADPPAAAKKPDDVLDRPRSWIRRQLTTFPTFRRIRRAIVDAIERVRSAWVAWRTKADAPIVLEDPEGRAEVGARCRFPRCQVVIAHNGLDVYCSRHSISAEDPT